MNAPLLALALVAAVPMLTQTDGSAAQRATSARLREGGIPTQIPQALGGGEVILALTVGAGGEVARVERIRVTPPYADLAAQAAGTWRFDPATVVAAGRSEPVAAPVLVAAVFRPPTFYAAPAAGVPPSTVGALPAVLPRVRSMAMPTYPPNALGDGIVLVEIEMNRRAEPRAYRVVSSSSGFDGAALDAARSWQFDPPKAADVPEPLFAYALIGFRAPLAPATAPGQ